MISLAVKYRPKTLDDVVGQETSVHILRSMIDNKDFPNCMLFTGFAGTGKTTLARIFVNEVNNHIGQPMEIDAAVYNGVDAVKEILSQISHKSVTSEYRAIIYDECQNLSASSWQALLKTVEEPPEKTLLVFCTTDPQKIPNTILSRVQRIALTKIPLEKIINRLTYILGEEGVSTYEKSAVELIAKYANGGMRDAITLLDKCLHYDRNLTVDNVSKALGIVSYDELFDFAHAMLERDAKEALSFVNSIFNSGMDMRHAIEQVIKFTLDVIKYHITEDFAQINIPNTYQFVINDFNRQDMKELNDIRNLLLDAQSKMRYSQSTKDIFDNLVISWCYG